MEVKRVVVMVVLVQGVSARDLDNFGCYCVHLGISSEGVCYGREELKREW